MKNAYVATVVLVAAMLAAGTIFGKVAPEVEFYTSWWFVATMALAAVMAVVYIVKERVWRSVARLLVYASIPVVLAGGALSTWCAQRGEMTLLPGVPCAVVQTESGDAFMLPFTLELTDFSVETYTGTHTPMDFVSTVAIDGQSHRISLNHILRYRGFRFYQKDYGTDGSSTLGIARDRYGIPVAYTGFAMLVVGLVLLIVERRGRYRQLLRGAALMLCLVASSSFATAQPATLPRATADSLGRMMMLYKGRVCPVQTFAKDFTTKLTGKATYRGLTSEQVLAGFMFYYDQWVTEPMVKVKGSGTWHLPSGDHTVARRSSIADLAFFEWEKLSPESNKNLRAAAEKYSLVRMLSSGRLLRIYPVADSTGSVGWYGQNDPLPLDISADHYLFVRRSLGYCQELVVEEDFEQLEHVFAQTLKLQQKTAQLPSAQRLRAERLYNSLTTGRWLAMLGITLGLLAFAYALVCMARGRRAATWVRVVGVVYVALLSIYLSAIFVLRWVAGGHVPMAGSFDSMNLMALVAGIAALVAEGVALRHQRSSRALPLLPVAMLVMGFCLLVAMMSGSNPPVTNLMPVLNSPLLAAHVAVIMFAYVMFFAIAVCGLAGLLLGRRADLQQRLQRLNLSMLYPAVLLLAIGIAIGALWANISWGNYWSWDPKEVWALITLIVYALPMHPSLRALQRPRVFHLYCLVALLCVAITYFGVNLVLGGIHAYN